MKRRILLALLAALLLSLLAVTWLLGTGSGLRFVLDQLLPADVTVEQAGGAIGKQIQLNGVRIAVEGLEIEISELKGQLRLTRLLRGEVAIHGLFVGGARAVLDDETNASEDDSEATEWAWPEPKLPLELAIERPVVDGLEVVRGGDLLFAARGLHAELIAYEDSVWDIRGFEADGDRVSGRTDLRYQADARHQIRADVKLSTYIIDNEQKIQIQIEGDKNQLAFKAGFDGAVAGNLAGAVLAGSRSPTWRLTTDLRISEPHRLDPAWPAEPVSLQGAFEGEGKALSGEGRLNWSAWPALEFVLEAGGLPAAFEVSAMRVSEPGTGASIEFTGGLTLTQGFPKVDGQLGWSPFDWPPGSDPETAELHIPAGVLKVTGEAGLYRISGVTDATEAQSVVSLEADGQLDLRGAAVQLDLTGNWSEFSLRAAGRNWDIREGRFLLAGNPDAFQFDTRFLAAREERPAIEVRIAGDGSRESLRISNGSLSAGDGKLMFTGRLLLIGTREFGLSIEGSNIDPAVFDPAWPGLLVVAGNLSGSWQADGISAQLSDARVSGRLRDQPMQARLKARLQSGRLQAGEIDTKWGAAEITARAKTDQATLVEWSLSVPDLGAITARGAGSISSEGALRGSLETPQLTLRLQGENLRYREARAQSLTANLNSEGNGGLLNLAARGISMNDRVLGDLGLEGSGSLEEHAGALQLSGATPAFRFGFKGGWSRDGWSGLLGDGELSVAGDPWLQTKVAGLAISPAKARLDALCLARAGSEVCMQVAWPHGSEALARLEVRDLPLAELGQLLPEGLDYSGDLTGSVTIDSPGPSLRAEASFTADDLKVLRPAEDTAIPLLELAHSKGTVRLANGRMALDFEGTTGARMPLLIEFSAPVERWSLVDGPVSGRVQGEFNNLGLLAIVLPEITGLSGQVRTDLGVAGSLSRPQLSGLFEINEASAQLPALGVTLTGINARAFGQEGSFDLDMSAQSGDGDLRLSGRAMRAASEWRGALQLQGTRFLASDLPEARVVITPRLSLQFVGRELDLSGEVQVVEARLAPRDLSTAVQSSPDEVLVSADAEARLDKRWRLQSEVSINLSEEVYFSGFGLDARIAGGLRVMDASGSVATATGELEIVDGTYEIYGRSLDIRRGRLLFSGGPLANPGLDIMATRTVQEDIEAGVLVRASLREPRVSLYSEPSMPPSQALSYLLVGQPLADIGDSDRQLVNDAAGRLASAGGGLLAQQLGRRLGLDDVNIASSGSGNQASLVIGTYLSPKLYASYGVGLFENVNTLRLRYLLSSRWTVRAESGLNQSVDLEYSLTR